MLVLNGPSRAWWMWICTGWWQLWGLKFSWRWNRAGWIECELISALVWAVPKAVAFLSLLLEAAKCSITRMKCTCCFSYFLISWKCSCNKHLIQPSVPCCLACETMPKIQLAKGMEHDYSIECEESKHTTFTKQQHDPLHNPYSLFVAGFCTCNR